jgi:hypothetical protein
VDNGIESQPAFRVWMQESVAPVSGLDDRPGRWIAETGWPGDGIEPRTLHLSEGRLGPPGPEARLEVRSPQTAGAAAGGWLVSSLRDQGEDDARSLCFDSEPLVERTEILGAPELQLVVSADRPHAFVAVRLVDVAPDGRATRVSYGLRNLTHSANHESWQPLVPGRPLEVRVALNHVAHAFPAGHRLRIAISPCYWPLVWPSPQPVALTVHTEPCRLLLPVRQAAARDAELPPFEAPECAPRSEWTPITRGGFERTAETDGAGDVVARMRSGHDEAGGVAMARCADADDYEGGDAVTVETRIHPVDPLRARARMGQRSELRREGWSVAVETDVSVSCSADRFRVEARLEAWGDGAPAFERHWEEEVPREGI